MARRLTGRRRRFVDEYLVDLNQEQAAIRAGYSAKSARSLGSQLMDAPDVVAAIDKAMKARSARTQITQDRVLDELAVLGFSSVDDYMIDENGRVTLAPKARPDAMRAVASIKRKQRMIPRDDGDPIVETDVEIRLWSKPDVLRMTGQHLGMFTDREPPLKPEEVVNAVRGAIRAMNAADGLADAA